MYPDSAGCSCCTIAAAFPRSRRCRRRSRRRQVALGAARAAQDARSVRHRAIAVGRDRRDQSPGQDAERRRRRSRSCRRRWLSVRHLVQQRRHRARPARRTACRRRWRCAAPCSASSSARSPTCSRRPRRSGSSPSILRRNPNALITGRKRPMMMPRCLERWCRSLAGAVRSPGLLVPQGALRSDALFRAHGERARAGRAAAVGRRRARSRRAAGVSGAAGAGDALGRRISCRSPTTRCGASRSRTASRARCGAIWRSELGAASVVAAPFDPAAKPDLIVDVDVQRFERVASDGAVLEARWTLRDGKRGTVLAHGARRASASRSTARTRKQASPRCRGTWRRSPAR